MPEAATATNSPSREFVGAMRGVHRESHSSQVPRGRMSANVNDWQPPTERIKITATVEFERPVESAAELFTTGYPDEALLDYALYRARHDDGAILTVMMESMPPPRLHVCKFKCKLDEQQCDARCRAEHRCSECGKTRQETLAAYAMGRK
jgi:hypothetical protein